MSSSDLQLEVSVTNFVGAEEKSLIGSSYYTNFVIELSYASSSWIVLRRYSEFYALHEKLQRKFPEANFPGFPSKYSDNSDETILYARQRAFDNYLKTIVQNHEILRSPEIQIFLELHECRENIFEAPSEDPETQIPLVNREIGKKYEQYDGYSTTLKILADLHQLHLKSLTQNKNRWQTRSLPPTSTKETVAEEKVPLSSSFERDQEIDKEEDLFSQLLTAFQHFPDACFFYIPQICNVLVYPWLSTGPEDFVSLACSKDVHLAVFFYLSLSHIIQREKEKRDKGIFEQPKPVRSWIKPTGDTVMIGGFESSLTGSSSRPRQNHLQVLSSDHHHPHSEPSNKSYSNPNISPNIQNNGSKNIPINSSGSHSITDPLLSSETSSSPPSLSSDHQDSSDLGTMEIYIGQRGKNKFSKQYFNAVRLLLYVEGTISNERLNDESDQTYLQRIKNFVLQAKNPTMAGDDEKTVNLSEFTFEQTPTGGTSQDGRSKIVHDSLFFLSNLVSAGEKLLTLAKNEAIRFEALKEHMQWLDENLLPAKICLPTFLTIDQVLHIPYSINDIDLLRSRERAPFLIRVEYLKAIDDPHTSFESLITSDFSTAHPAPTLVPSLQGGIEGEIDQDQDDHLGHQSTDSINEEERHLLMGTPPTKRRDHVALHSVISNHDNENQSGDYHQYQQTAAIVQSHLNNKENNTTRLYPASSGNTTTTLLAATRNPTMRDSTTIITSAAMPVGETWDECLARLKLESRRGQHPDWSVLPLIVKAKEDVWQEQFAMQLVYEFVRIFRQSQLPFRVRPYRVLAAFGKCGIIEAVPNCYSLHSIKKNTRDAVTLLEFFSEKCGGLDTPQFFEIQQNFVESTAAYSLISYFLQVKDRHNGNILISDMGDLVHIDYRKFLTNYPGTIRLEHAPFKLTDQMVEMMDGLHSNLWNYYCRLCVLGFRAIQQNIEQLTRLVEIMRHNELFDCFSKSKFAVDELRDRARLELDGKQTATYVLGLIGHAVDSSSTAVFDLLQYVTNGIL